MKSSKIGQRRFLGRKAFSSGLNMALFAACGPALANAPGHYANFAAPQPYTPPSSIPAPAAPTAASLPVGPASTTTTPHAMWQLPTQQNLPGISNVQLDLTSSKASIVIPTGVITGGGEATLSLGGVSTTYRTGDVVTPAEFVAIYQSQGWGGQKLDLDAQGRASGGTFALNKIMGANSPIQISSIVVPQSVTAVDFVAGKQNITMSGDLVNYGSIVEIHRIPNLVANFTANNIVNESGASITTQARGGNAGTMDLNFTANQQFLNYGSINASGSVTVSAPQITNNGQLTAQTGNINLTAPADSVLSVNNTGGTMSALQGAINLRDASYAGTANSSITGGDLLSQQLNLFSGGGTANVNVGHLTGTVSSSGSAVHVRAATDVLTLGSQCLTGDPTYYNSIGDIQITGDISVAEDLTIVAYGNITSTSGVTSISANDGTNGRNITIIAGADVTGGGNSVTPVVPGAAATASVSITGASGLGGNIDFSSSKSLTISSAGVQGGDITLAAFEKNGINGNVLMYTNAQIDASGSGGKSGDLTILAGRSTAGTAISYGKMAVGAADNVQIINAQPKVINGPLVYDTAGARVSGSLVADYSAIGSGDVILNGLVDGSSIRILAGATAGVQSVGFGVNPGSTISISGAKIIAIGDIRATAGLNIVSGSDISFTASNVLRGGTGDVTIVSGAAFTNDATKISITGASGASTSDITWNGTGDVSGKNITLVSFGTATTGKQSLNQTFFTPAVGSNLTFVSGYEGANGLVTTGGSQISLGSGTNLTISMTTPSTTTPVDLSVATPQTPTNAFLGGPVTPNGSFTLAVMPSSSNGNITYIQDAVFNITAPSFVSSGVGTLNNLTLYSGQGINLSTTIQARGLSLLSPNNITLNPGAGVSSPNGLTMISGHDIVTTGDIGNISTLGVTNGGNLAIVAGANFSLFGSEITIVGNSSSGGKIDLLTAGKVQNITSEGSNGTGGNITMAAFSGSEFTGTITIPDTSFITSIGGAGQGGSVKIVSGAESGTGIQIGKILAGDALAPVNAGDIILQTAVPATTTAAVFNTTGGMLAGDFVNPAATGTNADIQTGNLTTPGGNITVLSSRNVRLGQLIVSNTTNSTPAGTIKIETHGSETLRIFNSGSVSGSNYTRQLNADGGTSATGGTITVNNIDDGLATTSGIKLMEINVLSAKGASSGSITLQAGKRSVDIIDLGINSTLDVRPSDANGSGGEVKLMGYDLTWDLKGTSALNILADGGAISGAGGKITYMTYKDALLDLSNANTFLFSARGIGTTGGNGGTIIIQNGGSIVYNVSKNALRYNPATILGNGGNITLMAGTYNDAKAGNGNETLQITGPITADATGVGKNGGTVLLSSNSGIAFNVGLATANTNGVTGGITVNSVNGGKNGTITLINQNGGVTISTKLLAIDVLTVTAQNNGSILIGDPIGNPSTSQITLTTDGVGGVTQVAANDIITAKNLSVTVGRSGQLGGKTPLMVNASTMYMSGGLVANVTNSAPIINLTVDKNGSGNNGFNYLANSTGSTLNAGAIRSGGNVVIKAGTINFSGDVQSESAIGTVSITALSGDITSSTNNISAPKSVTLSAPNGEITVSKIGLIGERPDSIVVTAKENITVGSAGADDSLLFKVSSTAVGQGVITLGPTFFVTSPSGTITVDGTNLISAGTSSITGGKLTKIDVSATGADITLGTLSNTGTIIVEAKDALTIGSTSANTVNIKAGGNLTVTANSYLTATTNTGTLSLISTNGSILASSTTIAGGKTINLTATKGSITGGSIGNANTGAVTLTALQKIDGFYSLSAVNNIAIKTTGSGSNADIIVGSITAVMPGTSVITLTSGGSIQSNSVSAGKSVTVVSKDAASITQIGNLYNSLIPATISVTAANNIFVSSAIASNSITLKTTSSSAANGDIFVSGVLQALSPSGVISITASGTSSKTLQTSGTDISAGKSVTLLAPNGGIKTSGIGLNYPTGVVTITALKSIESGDILALTKISETTTTKTGGTGIKVGGLLNTTSGAISLVAAKGGVIVLPGTNITANGATSSAKATILLQAKDALNGTVTIGAGSNIATSGAGGGDVNIAVGATAKGINPTPIPSGITVVGATSKDNAYFGGNGLVTNTGATTITLKGADVVFSGTAVGAISIDSSTITADPPTEMISAAIAPTVMQSSYVAPAVQSATLTSTTPIAGASAAPTVSADGVRSTVSQMLLPLQGFANFTAPATRWISETEIVGGEIPVSLLREVSEHHQLGAGSVLAMPKVDTTLHTAHGDVSVAANSLVLVMALRDGLAVYNFDDTQSGAVKVKAHGHTFVVRPGTSSVIASAHAKTFAHVNPAQLLCYRKMVEQQLHNGMKAFHSEFSMMTAFAAIKPLKEIIGSTDKETRQVGNHFLKTMAILTQLQASGETFKQALRPQLTAYAPRD